MGNKYKTRLLEIFILVIIVIIASILRYPNLETNPGWYTDEGTLIDIAKHLVKGETQYMAVKDSVLLFGRPPLFVNLLALVFKIFGTGIVQLRTLTATLGVLSIVILYLMVRLCLGKNGFPLAATSAFILAIYPLSITYSRIGYSYILLASLILLAILAAWKYATSGMIKWLIFGALMIGIGSLSDVMILAILPAYLIIVFIRRWKDIFLAFAVALLPLAIYSLIMFVTQPDAFNFDIRSTMNRASGKYLIMQLPNMLINYVMFLRSDYLIIPAIIGIFILRPMRFSQIIFLFLAVPLLVLGRSLITVGFGYYYVSPLLPLIALGFAAVILYGIPQVVSFSNDAFLYIVNKFLPDHHSQKVQYIKMALVKYGNIFFICGFIAMPFAYTIGEQMFLIHHSFPTPVDKILVDPIAGRSAIDYINSHTEPSDLVIASPALSWALNCRTADFQMAVTIDGIETEHFPIGIDPTRFVYDTHVENARYVIYDVVWEYYGVPFIPEVATLAQDIKRDWPIVFEDGDIFIYLNPTMPK